MRVRLRVVCRAARSAVWWALRVRVGALWCAISCACALHLAYVSVCVRRACGVRVVSIWCLVRLRVVCCALDV